MNVFVISTGEDCLAAQTCQSQDIEFWHIKPIDDYTYARAFSAIWSHGESFITLEHDISPWPGALRQMWDCEEPFCAYKYYLPQLEEWRYALGCTKFSSELIKQFPGAALEWGGTHWMHLDAHVLGIIGNEPHIHNPPVTHIQN